jgi:broad specificity phosphatase PhoE
MVNMNKHKQRRSAGMLMVQLQLVALILCGATNVSCFQTKNLNLNLNSYSYSWRESESSSRLSFSSSRRSSFSLPFLPSFSSSLFSTVSTQDTDGNQEAVPEVQIVEHMPEPLPANLKNHYYLLRHGLSTANVAGIISSARSLAYSDKHGLTETGYQQGVDSATQLLQLLKQNQDKNGKREKIVFISSPFARARQTAQACLDGLHLVQDELGGLGLDNMELSTDIVLNVGLMERYFGRLDDQAIYTYAYVWPLDKFNVTHTAFDVESVAAVCTRLRQVVQDLETTYTDCHIVWVSHADVLQIAQLYGAGAENVGIFSEYRFANGEVRAMARNVDSLPDPSPLPAPERGTKSV